MVYENNNEGKKQIIKVFLHRTGLLIAEQDIHISIQKEAIQRLNMILDKISKENKKDLFSSAEILNVMGCLGKQITVIGDYDLQVSITEALCRMATSKQRQKLADQCFSMECAAKAFKRIKDSTFETDCRVFLNLINDLQGNERSDFDHVHIILVKNSPYFFTLFKSHAISCNFAFAQEKERMSLLMPVDEKLHDFWIDFNIGSQSISFYISSQDNEQESLWETVYIPEEDVENYTVEEMEGKKKLRIVMKHYLRIGRTEGIQICIVFKAVLNILEAAMNVFGSKKYRKVPGKHRNSVVKTTVQVIFEDQGSQVMVPESQLSQTPDGKEKPLKEKRKCSQPTQIIPLATESTPRLPIKQTRRNKRVSESSLTISDRRQRSAKKSDKCIMSLSISSLKKKGKPRLELQDYSEHSTNSSICKPKSKGLHVSVSADKETEIDESKMKVITEENDAEIVRDKCFRMSTDKQLADSVEVDSHLLEKKARHLVPCEIDQTFEPSEFVTPAHRRGQHLVLDPSLESHLSKQKSCSVDSVDQFSPKQKRYKQSAFSSVTFFAPAVKYL
ncbi:synaptonemal complex protein 2-like [Polypterus senegalus]|uniref:synaptonemal complex protein 2-like n=1 Tax=Polypterus senegalus TaxID=55291 RepID=UPI001963666D|nr:synaptonemal complex protein 2-like [Polypterus senegalus]